MNALIILFCKIISNIGKILKRGSSLPGMIALKLNPNILTHFKKGDAQIIVVTGSNGKGSTSSLIANALRKMHKKVAYNDSGSNLSFAIATCMMNHANIFGKLQVDYFVFEMDERYSPKIFQDLDVDITIITNITRDQPPRQGSPEIVANIIKNGLKTKKLILNADDPILQQFAEQQSVHYFDIQDPKQFYQYNLFDRPTIAYCPICNRFLKHNYFIFESHGDYYCDCGFKKPVTELSCREINFDKLEFVIEKFCFKLSYPSLFDVNNTMAAILCLQLLKVPMDQIHYLLQQRKTDEKIYSTSFQNQRKIITINNKNENAASFNQSLLAVNRDPNEKIIVVGWKEISRRYEFNDVSWLYDIDFEILQKLNVKSIYCVGIERYDIALRMKFAGLEDKVKIHTCLEQACAELKTTKETIYAILNFDYVLPFINLMRDANEN